MLNLTFFFRLHFWFAHVFYCNEKSQLAHSQHGSWYRAFSLFMFLTCVRLFFFLLFFLCFFSVAWRVSIMCFGCVYVCLGRLGKRPCADFHLCATHTFTHTHTQTLKSTHVHRLHPAEHSTIRQIVWRRGWVYFSVALVCCPRRLELLCFCSI